MPVKRTRNAGKAQMKEQLSREMRQSKLALFIQHFEKEGSWNYQKKCQVSHPLVALIFVLKCTAFSSHSTGAYERAGGQNGEHVGNSRQSLQSGADEDASFASEHKISGFNKRWAPPPYSTGDHFLVWRCLRFKMSYYCRGYTHLLIDLVCQRKKSQQVMCQLPWGWVESAVWFASATI